MRNKNYIFNSSNSFKNINFDNFTILGLLIYSKKLNYKLNVKQKKNERRYI